MPGRRGGGGASFAHWCHVLTVGVPYFYCMSLQFYYIWHHKLNNEVYFLFEGKKIEKSISKKIHLKYTYCCHSKLKPLYMLD